jgi:hypothetical protein
MSRAGFFCLSVEGEAAPLWRGAAFARSNTRQEQWRNQVHGRLEIFLAGGSRKLPTALNSLATLPVLSHTSYPRPWSLGFRGLKRPIRKAATSPSSSTDCCPTDY